jgi:transcriptional regulator with XRE-family HTH domain
MNIPQNLPITPLQSKAARYQLGLTQANVIQESGLPGHKLKGFETGRLIPDMKFLESLANFYQAKGIELSELTEGEGLTPVNAAAVKPISDKLQSLSGMAFRIAVPFDQVDIFLERMEAHDERVDQILAEPAKAGFLSDYDESTEALQRELFGLMAANYLLFRALQGRSLTARTVKTGDKKTQLDLLNAWVNTAELTPLLSGSAAIAAPAENETEEEV